MATHFELPANLTAEALFASLNDKYETHLVSNQFFLKTYYDSFDWRLYKADLTCEFNRSKQSSSFTLINRKTNELVASTILFDVPSFSRQFNPGKVRQTLEPILEMRALLPICTLEGETSLINIVNKDGKIVLNLLIDEFELLNNRLTLLPVKGYNKVAEQIVEMVTKELGLSAVDRPVLLDALKLQGRKPKSYSSKLTFQLTPEMPTDVACKSIFTHLLSAIKINEQGTIADIDSEFLHDFRVAVRRTRALLSQASHVLPEEALTRYKDFFSWLGQITGETRDLDVYLLNFEQYKKKLPAVIRQSINPLQHFLLAKQKKSQKQLAKKLNSSKYMTTLAEWQKYLQAIPHENPPETETQSTIKHFADQRIWKTYKQIIKKGGGIDKHSPPEALHNLRKTCKKLRYLMEFFAGLYPERRIATLIKYLKNLQEVLGSYQDYAVQQQQLQQFSEEMQRINTPNKTFLAMGVLIQDFEVRKGKARDQFSSEFSIFNKSETHSSFHTLFGAGK
ncbi:MAG: CHAD domain-containing protein [Methyloglobulus sp.]|nr:CHAD domain-containing protein [Methyloglobulus sp.]